MIIKSVSYTLKFEEVKSNLVMGGDNSGMLVAKADT
jgi:hypothetical protein